MSKDMNFLRKTFSTNLHVKNPTVRWEKPTSYHLWHIWGLVVLSVSQVYEQEHLIEQTALLNSMGPLYEIKLTG